MKPSRQWTVLMTTDTVGGVWNYCLELIAASRRYEIHFHLVALGPPPSTDQRKAAGQLANLTLHTCESSLEWMQDPWEEVEKAGRWLQSLAKKIRPDLLHCNQYSLAALEWPCPVVVVAHSCVFTWWKAVKGCLPPADWRDYFRQVRSGLHAADRVVSLTSVYLQDMQEIYGPLDRCSVISNGVSTAGIAGPAREEKIILSVGRLWDEAKNMRIWEQVEAPAGWEVRIAGAEEEPGRQRPLQLPGVKLLGYLPRENLYRQLEQANVFVHPARYEPFGLAPLEAALHGCALLLADIPTLREIWGYNADYFNPRQPASLQRALQQIVRDPEKLRSSGQKAKQRAQQFTTEKMAKSYFSMYQSIRQPNKNKKHYV